MEKTSIKIILIQSIFVIFLSQISHGYRTYYLEDYSEEQDMTISLGPTSSRDSSIILKAARNKFADAGEYKITVKPGNVMLGIVVTLQKLNLKKNIGSDCKDKLQVWKTNTFGEVLIYSDCSEKRFPQSLVLTPPFETALTFKLEKKSTWLLSGLEITLTSFTACPRRELSTTRPKSSLILCYIAPSFAKSFEFYCNDHRCINKHFKCDWRQNCGDDSDETCSIRMSGWGIAAIVISSIMLFSCVIVCCKRYRRRRQSRHQHDVTVYGSHAPPPPPPNYTYPPNPYPVQPQFQPQQQPMYQAGIENPGYYQQPPPPPYSAPEKPYHP